MPSGLELDRKLEDLGVAEPGLNLVQKQRRFARFEGTTFGIAPEIEWKKLRRDLLPFEDFLASSKEDLGLVKQFPYDPGIKPGTKVFQKPTPLAPDRRAWVKKEIQKWERMGIVKRVAHCECAVGVVLVERGQSEQDFRLCCNFVELNPYLQDMQYPIQDPLHIIDQSRNANLWTLIDIQACFLNFPVVPEMATYLGIVTQDGLYTSDRMLFGLTSAPMWCQYVMNSILEKSGVSNALGFFDDVTIPGDKSNWQALWKDTLKVLGALTDAGLMVGLKKCKFLQPKVVVLGYQLMEQGYQLASEFLSKWQTQAVPTSIKELQILLGKLLWCCPFVPEFKQLITPLEKILSPSHDGAWSEECTQSVNKLLKIIFGKITLHSAHPYCPLTIYPSTCETVGFIAATQTNNQQQEVPVAFLSRRLTLTEQKWSQIEKWISLVGWGIRKLRRYTTTSPQITVILPDEAHVAVVLDQDAHLRLRALMIDLEMYKTQWKAGINEWRIGEGLIEVPAGDPVHDPAQNSTIPLMTHTNIVLKRPSSKSYKVAEGTEEGRIVVQFDGGAAKALGFGGFLVWAATGQLHEAQALWYGEQHTTNNEAELQSLVKAMEYLVKNQKNLGTHFGILILGDSELIIGFCNRKYKPSKKFTVAVNEIRRYVKLLGGSCQIQFRHVYRDSNQLADWLSNIARHVTVSTNLSHYLQNRHPHLALFSPPPWPAKKVNEKLVEDEEQSKNLVVKQVQPLLGYINSQPRGKWGQQGICDVCQEQTRPLVDKQCWGCAAWYHPTCLGVQHQLNYGPYHCPHCWNKFRKEGIVDITLDKNVMSTVVAGSPPHDVDTVEQARCMRVARWFSWEEGRLFIQGDMQREVVPICNRARLVAEAAEQLAYPGGDRLYLLLKVRYFWSYMRKDCVLVCARAHPTQVEKAKFTSLPYIKATWKGRAPFRLWALDLVTRLLPPGKNGETTLGVAVCPFSKWIEAQPLPDKSSHTIMQWFHFRVICQFGVPWGVRVDQGTEFKGRFQEYCEYLGIKILTIYTAHPQANGLVERYNGVIRAGLRKSATFKPNVPWTELLPAILAGLRFLPTRLGYPPAWIAFKQEVQSLPAALGVALGGEGCIHEATLTEQERLLAEQEEWWAVAEPHIRSKLEQGDSRMEQQYEGRRSTRVSIPRVPLLPGSKVLMRQFVPGKNLQKSTGPYTFLRYMGTAGAEILNNKGRAIQVARANISPFLPDVTGQVEILEEQTPIDQKSDSDWSVYEEDWDT